MLVQIVVYFIKAQTNLAAVKRQNGLKQDACLLAFVATTETNGLLW